MASLPGIPWYQCLLAHALIHGGAVALATGDVALGMCEVVVHAVIDYLKCSGLFGFNTDQTLHVASKILWLLLLRYAK